MKKTRNQRVFKRIRLKASVAYSVSGKYYWEKVSNISSEGVFIATRAPHDVGKTVNMVIAVPDVKNATRISGTIMHKTPHGVGIRYSD